MNRVMGPGVWMICGRIMLDGQTVLQDAAGMMTGCIPRTIGRREVRIWLYPERFQEYAQVLTLGRAELGDLLPELVRGVL